jgi:hypothetical protein
MLRALVLAWEEKCQLEGKPKDLEYLRDLKRRYRSVETRIKALSI